MNIELPYILLGIGWICSVMQASLEKAGIGHIESLPNSFVLMILGLLSLPLNLLSNAGLIIITLWAFFELDFLPAALTLLVCFVGYSFLWGGIVARLCRSSAFEIIVSMGIPIVFALKTLTAFSVIYLAYLFI